MTNPTIDMKEAHPGRQQAARDLETGQGSISEVTREIGEGAGLEIGSAVVLETGEGVEAQEDVHEIEEGHLIDIPGSLHLEVLASHQSNQRLQLNEKSFLKSGVRIIARLLNKSPKSSWN